MAAIKGKGILYEDDDDPIKLTDQDDSLVNTEYHLSLIGKILNPKKQNVEKLLQTMPAQWGVQDRVSTNDLGNGKFLINFSSQEDLQSVLRSGPFHFNFCMFVLVRWEPIVHDDYPWSIPFKVELVGIPLHLWTVKNMKSIGGRLGHVHEDSIELSEASMLIDVDSRRPLKFTKKIESPEGDEVTIDIKYGRLFKHCTICGLMTHEKGYCPTEISAMQGQKEREGVFARVQLPQENTRRQPLLHDPRGFDQRKGDIDHTSLYRSSYNDPTENNKYNVERYSYASRYKDEPRDKYYEQEKGTSKPRMDGINRNPSHSDRIMRARDIKHKEVRYGGFRQSYGPYDRKGVRTWREKPKSMTSG
ncbi:hypothetical protein Bca52824_011126 [Brassica carinata]|uniref:DUF4283 domain-containing protein n=1 Tax=Brassica carinata TaxID=52824 RepID=A0A8X7WCP1_BRACI|nr:hypothetical protein Bca52824_011126 [Brassica carinata]